MIQTQKTARRRLPLGGLLVAILSLRKGWRDARAVQGAARDVVLDYQVHCVRGLWASGSFLIEAGLQPARNEQAV